MASGVEVDISDSLVISALNTPGGGVFEWRDDAAAKVVAQATATARVGSIMNQIHRIPTVGEWKKSFGFDRVGSNGHRVRATIYNGSAHAWWMEEGRHPTGPGYERFAWRGWNGQIRIVRSGTHGYRGDHTLRNACNTVGAATGDWGPLT
jgi:hypothetical protein